MKKINWQHWLWMAVSGLGTLFALTGCQSTPGTGRSQLIMITEAQEKNMGESSWKELKKTEKPSSDPRMNAALQRIGKNLATTVNRPDYKWEFVVFANNTPNAFCLPGGKVGVYSGLFPYTANDAEMATVVGHEIAHAVCRHGAERVSQGMLQQAGAIALGAVVDDSRIQQAYGITTNMVAILPYSRKHEYEADAVGLKFMAMAGYDPQAALTFWQKFGKLDKNSSPLEEYLSTHPLSENRLDELRKAMPEALKLYQAAPVKRGLGESYASATVPSNVSIGGADAPAGNSTTARPSSSTRPATLIKAPPVAPVPSGANIGVSRNDLGFVIGCPSGWQEHSTDSSVVFASGGKDEVISVQAVNSAENGGTHVGVSDLADTVYRQVTKSAASSRVYRSEPAEIHSRVGQEFYVDLNQHNQQYRQWFVIFPRLDGRKFYVFSYTAATGRFSDGMVGARQTLQTFRFLNDSANNAPDRGSKKNPGVKKKK